MVRRGGGESLLFFLFYKITLLCYLLKMIHFIKGQTTKVVVTLKEKQTLSAPNYLFFFTSRATDNTKAFVILNNADLSAYKDRFNAFNIVTNSHFANYDSGEYTYAIYEQTSSSNLNPALATNLLEVGQMSLKNATEFEFTTYNQTNNTFIVRDI